MSVSQSYGVLRIVHMRLPAEMTKRREKDLVGRLSEESLVHLITRRETTIGRALSSDLILWDPAVSRLHAHLVLDEQGWHICNVTGHNTLYVNGYAVSNGENVAVQPQDFLLLGNTVLQLIAPQQHIALVSSKNEELIQHLSDQRPFPSSDLIITDPQVNSVPGKKEEEDIDAKEDENDKPCSISATKRTTPAPLLPLSERKLRYRSGRKKKRGYLDLEAQCILPSHRMPS